MNNDDGKKDEAEAKELLSLVGSFAITTHAELEGVTEVLAEVKKRWNALDEREKEITRPLNEGLKKARDLFRPAKDALAEAERQLKALVAGFHAREAEHNAKALAAGNVAAIAHVSDVRGTSVRYVTDFEVTDEKMIPRELCTPDPAKIKKYIADLGVTEGELPGLRVFQKPIVSSRAR